MTPPKKDDGALEGLPRETSVVSLEDLIAKAHCDDLDGFNTYLSSRLDDEFAEVDLNLGDDVFAIYQPETHGSIGLHYPFTLAELDDLINDLDIAYAEATQEYDDLVALCAAVGGGRGVADLEAAMSAWALVPVTVSRRATKHLVATGPHGRAMIPYPLTVAQAREAAYELHYQRPNL